MNRKPLSHELWKMPLRLQQNLQNGQISESQSRDGSSFKLDLNVREDLENEIWQKALTVKFLARHPLHVKPVPVLGTVGTNKTKNVRARVKELMKTGSGFRAPGELCVVVILDASTIPWSSPLPLLPRTARFPWLTRA